MKGISSIGRRISTVLSSGSNSKSSRLFGRSVRTLPPPPKGILKNRSSINLTEKAMKSINLSSRNASVVKNIGVKVRGRIPDFNNPSEAKGENTLSETVSKLDLHLGKSSAKPTESNKGTLLKDLEQKIESQKVDSSVTQPQTQKESAKEEAKMLDSSEIKIPTSTKPTESNKGRFLEDLEQKIASQKVDSSVTQPQTQKESVKEEAKILDSSEAKIPTPAKPTESNKGTLLEDLEQKIASQKVDSSVTQVKESAKEEVKILDSSEAKTPTPVKPTESNKGTLLEDLEQKIASQKVDSSVTQVKESVKEEVKILDSSEVKIPTPVKPTENSRVNLLQEIQQGIALRKVAVSSSDNSLKVKPKNSDSKMFLEIKAAIDKRRDAIAGKEIEVEESDFDE